MLFAEEQVTVTAVTEQALGLLVPSAATKWYATVRTTNGLTVVMVPPTVKVGEQITVTSFKFLGCTVAWCTQPDFFAA